jgi:DNA-binding MarR family transcriptional regulator
MAQLIKADKDYTLFATIQQLADIFIKIRERELLPQKISVAAAETLFLINALGKEVTPAKLSMMTLRDPHITAGILVRMETQGLINRIRDMEPKNRIRVTLTTKGKKELKQTMKLEGTTGILAVLSTVQQKQLKATLTALKEAGRKELNLSTKVLTWP